MGLLQTQRSPMPRGQHGLQVRIGGQFIRFGVKSRMRHGVNRLKVAICELRELRTLLIPTMANLADCHPGGLHVSLSRRSTDTSEDEEKSRGFVANSAQFCQSRLNRGKEEKIAKMRRSSCV